MPEKHTMFKMWKFFYEKNVFGFFKFWKGAEISCVRSIIRSDQFFFMIHKTKNSVFGCSLVVNKEGHWYSLNLVNG